MADQVSVTNWPDSGSHARVAFDLWRQLLPTISREGSTQDKISNALELYAQCLNATTGSRFTASNIK